MVGNSFLKTKLRYCNYSEVLDRCLSAIFSVRSFSDFAQLSTLGRLHTHASFCTMSVVYPHGYFSCKQKYTSEVTIPVAPLLFS